MGVEVGRRRSRRASVLALLVLGLLGAAGAVDVEGYYPRDRAMWEFIVSAPGSLPASAPIAGMVLPHHYSDLFDITRMWREVAAGGAPSLVLLLSPDHGREQAGDILLPGEDVRFTTQFAEPILARAEIQALAAGGNGRRVPASSSFLREHGIFAHTPFIARFLPGTRLLPIAIKQGAEPSVLEDLIRDLRVLLPEDSLVVASVDFSHYNPEEISRFHDVLSVSALAALDAERLLDAEVDSPECLYILARLMALGGKRDFQLLKRTDLQEHFRERIADNTSHVLAYFHPAETASGSEEGRKSSEADRGPQLSFLAFPAGGEARLPSGIIGGWRWNPEAPDALVQAWPALASLSGEEDRFLCGADLYLFSPLPGAASILTRGGIRIAYGSLAALTGPSELAALADTEDYLLIVAFEEAAFEESLVPIAEKAGVDLIILRDGEGAAIALEKRDSLSILRLPGSMSSAKHLSLGALSWSRESGFSLLALPLAVREGGLVYALLPSLKSYARPVFLGGRE